MVIQFAFRGARRAARALGHVAVAIAVLGLSGCGRAPGDAALDGGSNGADACAIAQAARTGTQGADREIRRWQDLVARGTNGVAYLERLGWAYVAAARAGGDDGDYLLAAAAADCIDQRVPGAPQAMLLRGHALHQMHRFAEAEAVARRLVAVRGRWFDRGLLGDVLMERGDIAAAAIEYQAMMDERPGPQAYARAAHLRWLGGDLAGAIEAMRLAVRSTHARDPDAAWGYVRLAGYERQAGHDAAAAALVEAALRMQPRHPAALHERGRQALSAGSIDAAIPDLQAAADLRPLPEYQWALVEALHVAGRAAQAAPIERRLAERGAVEDPRTYALYLATRGGDAEMAVRLARAELAARADAATVDALAWSLHAAGRAGEAWDFARRVMATGTRDPRLCLHNAVIASTAGAGDIARTWLTHAQARRHMLLPSERSLLDNALARAARLAAGRGTRADFPSDSGSGRSRSTTL